MRRVTLARELYPTVFGPSRTERELHITAPFGFGSLHDTVFYMGGRQMASTFKVHDPHTVSFPEPMAWHWAEPQRAPTPKEMHESVRTYAEEVHRRIKERRHRPAFEPFDTPVSYYDKQLLKNAVACGPGCLICAAQARAKK